MTLQVHEENDVVKYDQPPIFDKEDEEMANDTMPDVTMLPRDEGDCIFLEPSLVSSTPIEVNDNGKK